jgi:hypothetical protein
VKLRAREERVEKIGEGEYQVSIRARPVEGKANEAVIRAIAAHFGVAPSLVEIVSGHAARRKIIEIKGIG